VAKLWLNDEATTPQLLAALRKVRRLPSVESWDGEYYVIRVGSSGDAVMVAVDEWNEWVAWPATIL